MELNEVNEVNEASPGSRARRHGQAARAGWGGPAHAQCVTTWQSSHSRPNTPAHCVHLGSFEISRLSPSC